MRLALIPAALACAALGCSGYSMPSSPSVPSKLPDASTPAKPTTPDAPKAELPRTPATPTTPDAPKQTELPKAPSKPGTADVPKTTTPDAPKTPDVAKTPDAAPIDKTPVKADLSKIKFKTEPAELFGYDDGESRAFFYSNGLGEVALKVPADGDYEIVVTASCQAAKGENAKFKLKVDGTQVGAETQLKAEDAKDYTFTAPLKAGEIKIGAEFTNDMYKEGEYDLNFYLHGVKVVRVK